MTGGSFTLRPTHNRPDRMVWEHPENFLKIIPSDLVEGAGSWNSPGHGSVDSQSCG